MKKQPAIDEWIKKIWCINLEYISAIRKGGNLPATWMDPEDIMLREVSQRKTIPHDFTYMWNLKQINKIETDPSLQRTNWGCQMRGGGGQNRSSVQFSHSVVSDSLRPHESQHARPPCPSPTPRVYPNSCPSSWWCHPAISSSVVPLSSCPQSLPASGSFLMSQLFTVISKIF